MTEIRRGDFVIVNHTDRPSARMVAVVNWASDVRIEVRYLSADLHQTVAIAYPADVTPLSAFGIECLFNSTTYKCIRNHALTPVAQYIDGSPRRWQDNEESDWLVLDKRADQIITSHVIGENKND